MVGFALGEDRQALSEPVGAWALRLVGIGHGEAQHETVTHGHAQNSAAVAKWLFLQC